MLSKYFPFLISLILCSINSLWAQNQFISDNYMLDDYLLNPALSGRSRNCLKLRAGFREQWLKIKDAPSTQFFSANTSIGKHYGIGTALYSDQNGSYTRTGGLLSLGYHVQISRNSELSLGLSASLWQRNFKLQLLDDNTQDPALLNIGKAFLTANASCGAFYVYQSKFFASLSALNLIPLKESYTPDEPKLAQNFIIRGGFKHLTRDRRYSITPSLLFSYSTKGRKEIDINSIFELKSKEKAKSYAMGISIKYSWFSGTAKAFSILPTIGGIHENWEIRYIYQLQIAGPQLFNYGTHSIMIGYKLQYSN